MDWKSSGWKRGMIVGIVVLCTVVSLFAGFKIGNRNADVVARVNGQSISKDELYDLMVAQDGQQALEVLIAQKVAELEAEKQKITVTNEDVQKKLDKYYADYGGQEAFNATLAMSGYTLDKLKEELTMNIKIEKLLAPRITITEDEMKTYFEANKETFAQEKQVKASHILVDTIEKANEVKQKLAQGADFTQLAKEYSTDTLTKDYGGDLGFFGPGTMAAEFEAAAFSMNAGDISDPVKTEYGYHIIKVTDKKDAQEANYEQSKDEINAILFSQKAQDEYGTWLDEMYQQYDIQNFLTVN